MHRGGDPTTPARETLRTPCGPPPGTASPLVRRAGGVRLAHVRRRDGIHARATARALNARGHDRASACRARLRTQSPPRQLRGVREQACIAAKTSVKSSTVEREREARCPLRRTRSARVRRNDGAAARSGGARMREPQRGRRERSRRYRARVRHQVGHASSWRDARGARSPRRSLPPSRLFVSYSSAH